MEEEAYETVQLLVDNLIKGKLLDTSDLDVVIDYLEDDLEQLEMSLQRDELREVVKTYLFDCGFVMVSEEETILRKSW